MVFREFGMGFDNLNDVFTFWDAAFDIWNGEIGVEDDELRILV